MPDGLRDEEKLTRNKGYIDDLEVRAKLFQQFAPTFYFHKQEQSFPLHADDFVRNVIEVKHAEYTNIQERQKRDLTPLEEKELEIINKYFWKEKGFNPDYKEYEGIEDFKEMVAPSNGSDSKFLVFDEKKYGYKVGEKINIVGIAPKGHPKYDPNKKSAPIVSSIIPTKEGYFIQYECVYSLNNAIKGTRWLRDLLPSGAADKADNFGLHYGDCEGIGVYVKVDDAGKATMESMQTFAHGRSGAREVPAKDCTFDNGQPEVFVGLGGHPSYADNFVGRNKFMDVVGDSYKIVPEQFIDVSPDKIAEKSQDIPPSLNTFPRLADSNPIVFSDICHPHDEKQLKVQSQEWHRYNPSLILTKAWNKIKSAVQNMFGHKKEQISPNSVDIKSIIESKDKAKDSPAIEQLSPAKEQTKIIEQKREASWVDKVETPAASVDAVGKGRV